MSYYIFVTSKRKVTFKAHLYMIHKYIKSYIYIVKKKKKKNIIKNLHANCNSFKPHRAFKLILIKIYAHILINDISVRFNHLLQRLMQSVYH